MLLQQLIFNYFFFWKTLLGFQLLQWNLLFLQISNGTTIIQYLLLLDYSESNIVALARDGSSLPEFRRFILHCTEAPCKYIIGKLISQMKCCTNCYAGCDLFCFGINTEEVGEAVLDTKYWFKTTSEYSPRTASFHNQFQKVSNKILSKREGK